MQHTRKHLSIARNKPIKKIEIARYYKFFWLEKQAREDQIIPCDYLVMRVGER
jgi:hypothetical protein